MFLIHYEGFARELAFVSARHQWSKNGVYTKYSDFFEAIYSAAGAENRFEQRSHYNDERSNELL
ncbi:MAG: hypothetical protein COB71_01070 [Thiotrichales bacterium]|nr:MAG: hypothetical protein COB71_01070 [Thiotrichales bacterium]